MNVIDFQEIWQVDIGSEVYEATFEVLTQWINEGSLLPQDKVRRGNLRWIEARRVPALLPFFNAKEAGAPLPVVTTTAAPAPAGSIPAVQTDSFVNNSAPTNIVPVTDPYRTTLNEPIAPDPNTFSGEFGSSQVTPDPYPESFGQTQVSPDQGQFTAPTYAQPTAAFVPETAPHVPEPIPVDALPTVCSMHPSSAAFFVCDTCANVFCKLCPKSYGGTVRICPFCGAMCQRIEQKLEKAEKEQSYRAAVTGGFGFGDFGAAFAYPFKFKTSLVIGALMFMIVTIGQGASSFGGFFMMSASLMCYMLGNMLYFGILTNVLENFSQGFTERNFMPSFDDFSIWDDVVHPFFLSIAVYLVSFGLFLSIIIGSVVYVSNSIASAPSNVSVPFPNDPNLDRYNKAYGDGEMPNESEISKSSETGRMDEEEEFRKMDEFIKEQRKKQLESGLGKTPETIQKERGEVISRLLKMALPLLLLAGLGFIWGVFYLPAACLVAGYTRSFMATLNPKIGLETIRILGGDYVKILVMGLIVGIISLFVGMFLAIIFLPFDMPGVGNLPAKAIGALVSFYLSVVFSVVLGFALYKNAEKLQLFRS